MRSQIVASPSRSWMAMRRYYPPHAVRSASPLIPVGLLCASSRPPHVHARKALPRHVPHIAPRHSHRAMMLAHTPSPPHLLKQCVLPAVVGAHLIDRPQMLMSKFIFGCQRKGGGSCPLESTIAPSLANMRWAELRPSTYPAYVWMLP
mmetsp:Transcript_28985/g.74509  ORF Transcript_28985/g.74509 Transcript_28985/m.74509 type:complete len:148 (-) Transcript_28985:1510-1953(-)